MYQYWIITLAELVDLLEFRIQHLQKYNDNLAAFKGMEDLEKVKKISGCQEG